ncbi:site-2 protease family protein [Candidatus Woesearchaeota archaeon]|nr:site-2 protease family protein [Candidatus Woesearchaeota archaeon]
MDVLGFITEYKWVILFYILIILFITAKRDKFTFQAKFIALYKTKIGLKLIDRIGTKHSEFIKILGYIGIGIGYAGMLFILYFIVKGVYDLVFVPGAPAVVAPVLPGVHIPGSPIFVPFWYGIAALFIVVLIHEFSHGIVAKAHGLPVLNSGIVFFGPLIGAFVEPDEKKMKKESDVVQYSIFAAGPFSNILLAGLVILIVIAVFNPIANAYVHPIGVSFTEVTPGMPADLAGLKPGVVYNRVNNITVNSTYEFISAFDNIGVGERVIIANEDSEYQVVTTSKEEEPGKPVIGVNLETRYQNDDSDLMKLFFIIVELFSWIFMLSLGLGLANLLPIGPVDGGRMIQVSLSKVMGEKKGNRVWTKLTIFMVGIIIILVITPIIRALI